MLVPTDTNADGRTTVLDALVVINSLPRTRFSGEAEAVGASSSIFTDVNGDGRTTVLDALLVINHLQRESFSRLAGAEGEEAVHPPTQSRSDHDYNPMRKDDFGLSIESVERVIATFSEGQNPQLERREISAIGAVKTETVDEAIRTLLEEMELARSH